MRLRLRWEIKTIVILCCLIGFVLLITFLITKKSPPSEIPEVSPIYINILNKNGEVEKIELEKFLIGVVAAEMPASFSDEALKAQAVAARTYVMSYYPPYGQPKHDEAIVCCDSTHCQAYIDENEMRERWGDNYDKYYDKIAAAVLGTSGKILFWQNNIAQAPFCSTCGGKTEDVEYCWGKAIPYLISVDCAYCEHSPKYSDYRRFNLEEAATLLNTTVESLYSIKIESYTPGDRVNALFIAGKEYKGTDIRTMLSLNSATFNWLIIGNYIIFTTIGYGHGVGLCQYGADGMAKSGYDYCEILQHYYPGTTIQNIDI